MPAQKRSSSENLHDEESLQPHFRRKQSRRERQPQDEEEDYKEQVENDDDEEEEAYEEEEDSDGSDPEDLSEFVSVNLMELRKDVQCPICLGIIKKTRTVMECMHRFCRECIDKSMRLGNNECPACRTHCASRRSLRDDPRYDIMIESLYPDIEKYEAEELAFHEEEKTHYKQIQESIAQIFQRQSEALVRARTTGKDTAAASTARLPRNCRNAYSRRRNITRTEIQGSGDNDYENDEDGNKDPSSTDERGTEIKQKRYKYRRRAGAHCSRTSPSAANSDGGSKESRGTSPGTVWNTEKLTWGRGGARSHTRQGSASGSKHTRSSTRLSKLVDYLQSLHENDDEYVAHETPLQAEDVEMPMVKETPNVNGEQSTINSSTLMDDPNSLLQDDGRCEDGLQNLEGQESIALPAGTIQL